MSESQSVLSAHRVLEFVLTKAAVSAKTHKTTLRIPYKELLASIGKETDNNIDLVLTLETSWDESTADAESDELNIDEIE